MEDRGLQDDPRYSALLAMRAKQGGMAPPSPGPPMDPNRFDFLYISIGIPTNMLYSKTDFLHVYNSNILLMKLIDKN